MADRGYGYDYLYLKNTVGGPLAEALAQLSLDQPEDPVEYVGKFLLKHVANERLRQSIDPSIHNRKSDEEIALEKAQLQVDKLKERKLIHDEVIKKIHIPRGKLQWLSYLIPIDVVGRKFNA